MCALVTGVQTCALPILLPREGTTLPVRVGGHLNPILLFLGAGLAAAAPASAVKARHPNATAAPAASTRRRPGAGRGKKAPQSAWKVVVTRGWVGLSKAPTRHAGHMGRSRPPTGGWFSG